MAKEVKVFAPQAKRLVFNPQYQLKDGRTHFKLLHINHATIITITTIPQPSIQKA